MQNQLTPSQSNLQQSGNNLQQNSSNLQQNATPTTSSDVSTTLSQNAPTTNLQVQAAKTDPSIPSQTYLPGTPISVWIVPVAFAVAVVLAVTIWSRLRQQLVEFEEETPELVEPPKQPTTISKPKTGKKKTRRQRQSNR